MVSKTYQKLIELRLGQGKRLLYDLGNYGVLILIAILILHVFLFYALQQESASLIISLIVVGAILGIHSSREDVYFLKSHFEYYKKMMTLEYLLLISPILILSAIHLNYTVFIAAVGAAILAPYYHYKKEFRAGNPITNLLPIELFEWKSGLRKIYFAPVLFYILSYVGTVIPYLPMVLLFFCSTSVASFYDDNESVDLLTRFGDSGKNIFNTKSKIHMKYLLLLYLPVMVVSSIFHPENIWIHIAFLMSQVLLIGFLLTSKYKHYTPQYNPMKNSNFTAVMVLLSAFPLFFFIPGLYFVIFRSKAINRIQQFV
jgi:hypothetical protein